VAIDVEPGRRALPAGLAWAALLFLAGGVCRGAEPVRTDGLEVVDRPGDWIVTGTERVAGKHIRLRGNLVLEKDGRLELDDCLLEIQGTKSREHLVDWKGGTLVTRRSTLGGFVRDDGVPIHTVFHLFRGHWEAIDTVVQYSYGISFGSGPGPGGSLAATRLTAGPRSDAVIASGTANIRLTDSTFPIAVSIPAQSGGKILLDLPINRPLDRVFEASTIPGLEYRLELKHTVVPGHWFVFVRNIGPKRPRCEVVFGDCPRLIVALQGSNVTGESRLSSDLAEPVDYGNVCIRRADASVQVFFWALYANGDQTDVTVRGPASLCELMQRGGRIRLLGTPGRNDLVLGCTTLELSHDAQLDVENVHLGSTSPKGKVRGEANVEGSARMTGRNVSVDRVVFHTRAQGSVRIDGVRELGGVTIRADGGPVELRSEVRPQSQRQTGRQ